jgi:hypothetical protein
MGIDQRNRNAPEFKPGDRVCYTARFLADTGGDHVTAGLRGTVQWVEVISGDLFPFVEWDCGVSHRVLWRSIGKVGGVLAGDRHTGYCTDCGRITSGFGRLCDPCRLEITASQPKG